MAWLPYALLVRHLWWLTDDAYISFRYARSWATGHGPRFNLWSAAPVEGYSNFLWMALATVVETLGAAAPAVMPWLSFAAGTLLLWRVFARLRADSALVALVATLALGLYPPFAAWSTGGLATMPLALGTFLLFEQTSLDPERLPDRAGLIGLVVALVLLRTEGLAWAVGLLGLGLLAGGPPARRRRLLLAVGAALLTWFVHRGLAWAWYGDLVASPTRAKSSLGLHSALTGLRYVGHHLLGWQALVLPLLAAPLALRARGRDGWLLLAFVLAALAYAVGVGGDWMLFGRFLVPAMAPLALLLGWAMVAFSRPAVGLVLGLATLTLGLLPLAEVQLAPQTLRESLSVRWPKDRDHTDLELWRRWQHRADDRVALARLLDTHLPADATVVSGGAGIIGYYSGLSIYDQHGLVTPEALAPGFQTPDEPPGHTVYAPNQSYLELQPTVIDYALLGGKRLERSIPRRLRSWRRYHDDYVPVLLPLDEGRVWHWLLVLQRRDSTDVDDWESWREVLEAAGSARE